ncbi:MAG: pyruvate kinase [Deltaproteobacteria bacterium]|jgi:pyruvate kinase|nr:pyruvate kinase [Deltaproteobacteria bacterium]
MSPVLGEPIAVRLAALQVRLHELRAALKRAEGDAQAELDRMSPEARPSGQNLVHYYALRRQELRPLQAELQALGLSSLGRSEAHVLRSLQAVGVLVDALLDHQLPALPPELSGQPGPSEALEVRSLRTLGPRGHGRNTRIMVTMPSELARDPGLAERYLRAGMQLARINTAHDRPADWQQMIRHLRLAAAQLDRPLKVVVDLAGPKIRTGPLLQREPVLKLRVAKDELGRPLDPVRAWLVRSLGVPKDGRPEIPVDVALLQALSPGNEVHLRDARGRRRTLRVLAVEVDRALVAFDRTTYLVPGLALTRAGGPKDHLKLTGVIGDLPVRSGSLAVTVGESFLLRRDAEVPRGSSGEIGCLAGAALAGVKVGHPIAFDDGKIEGIVEEVLQVGLRIRVLSAPPGATLGPEKGINLPQSPIDLPCLSSADLEALDFAVEHADLVSLSFVRTPQDVGVLLSELALRGAGEKLGVILKIETRSGFENVGPILLEGLRHDRVALMIARGDLAVECGFDRLAEVQEELLWVSEAAHVPVIWATQVLESLAKTGRASRAEITDAAMSERAECVMLNKGPYLEAAIAALANILVRMEAHQHKKTPLLRPLRIAGAQGS